MATVPQGQDPAPQETYLEVAEVWKLFGHAGCPFDEDLMCEILGVTDDNIAVSGD